MSLLKKYKYLFLLCFVWIYSSQSWAQTYSFTTAGATGRTGPSQAQINTAYTSSTLAGAVTVNNGIQQWTVPVTGPYNIELAGAKAGASGDNTSVGGNGAKGKTQVNLTQGQVLLIVVGQRGGTGSSYFAGGGGGASFVRVNGNSLPIIVAPGGGGGTRNATTTDENSNAAGVGNQSNSSDLGGYYGKGYGSSLPDHTGGGGAGWSFDGSIAPGSGAGPMSTARNGLMLKGTPNGGYGSPNNPNGYGGFGGGGGGGESNGSGGGGGGYQGGNGGVYDGSGQTSNQHGAGGYGYGVSTWLGTNAGDGYVTITLLCNTSSTNPTAPSTQTFCASSNPTVASLSGSGNNLLWYTSSSGGTALATNATLTTGTYYLEATDTNSGSTIYCPSARVAVSVIVYATTPAPTAVNVNTPYDGNTKTGSATVGAGLTLKWYAAASGATLATAPSGTAVGTYTAWAAAVDPTCGESTSRTQVTVTITAAPVVLTATAQNKLYGEVSSTAGVQGTNYTITGLQGTDAVMNVSLGYSGSPAGNLATAGVGSYTITPSGLTLSSGSLNNYSVTYNTGVLTINRAPLSITADAQQKEYDGAVFSGFTVSYTGFVNSESNANLAGSLSFAGTATTAKNVGSYTITPLGYSSNNYQITYTNGTLQITAKTINVTADTKTKTYGDTDPALTYQFSPALVSGDSFSGSLSRSSGENVGNYAINQNTLALSSNYTLNYTGANLSIGAKTINVTADTKTKTYGDTDPSLTYQFSPALVSGDSFSGSLSRSSGENVGTYAINQNTLSLSNNYTLNYTGANLSIGAKTINVTADTKTKTYGDTDPALTYQFSPALVSGDSFSGSLSRASGENVGTYSINQNTLALSSNYTLSYTGANLSIGAKTINVTANTKTKTYGDTDPAFTYQFSPALVSGDSFSGSLSRASGENVGTYAINQNTLSLSNNYTLNYTGANLSIGAKTINVTADAKTKTYGNADPAFTFTSVPAVGSTLANGELVGFTGTLARVAGEGAGTYSIGQGNLNNTNYVIAFTPALLSIVPASPVISISGSTTFCAGGNVVLSSSVSSGNQWYANGVPIPGANSPFLTVSTSGDYTVAATQAGLISAQSAVTTVTVNQIPQLNQPLNQIVQNRASVGAVSFLSSIPGTNFTWTNSNPAIGLPATGSGNIPSFIANYTGTPTQQAIATIVVTPIANGCAGTSKTFTITVNVNTPPVDLVLSKANFFEKNQVAEVVANLSSVDTDAGDSHTYSLVSGDGDQDNYRFSIVGNQLKAADVFNFAYRDRYLIRLRTTDAAGEYLEKAVVITLSETPKVLGTGNKLGEKAQIAPSPDPIISKGFSSQLQVLGDNLVSYNWASSASLIATGSTAIARPLATTTYDVRVTNSFGSSTTVSITVQVVEDHNITPYNMLTPDGDGHNDAWIIENLDAYPLNEVKVYDISGSLVFYKKDYRNDWTGADLASGTYYYVILFGSNNLVQRGFITLVR